MPAPAIIPIARNASATMQAHTTEWVTDSKVDFGFDISILDNIDKR
jgi:hypothetical protein